jgi:hypothetical protein
MRIRIAVPRAEEALALGAADIVCRAMAFSNDAGLRRGQLPPHFRRILIGVEANHQMQGVVG